MNPTGLQNCSAHDAIFALATTAWEEGNVALAFDLFRVGAQHGDPSSKGNLGYFYDLGIHVPKSKSRALFWYHAACNDGSSSAAANIATVYRDTKEYGKMIWWLRRAIRMGDGDALYDLGRCYVRGVGVEKNLVKAEKLFQRVLTSEYVTDDSQEKATCELQLLRKKRSRS